MHQWNANTFNFSSPYRFNGKELDPETGLAYYGARYYQNKIAVWLSVDPAVARTHEPYSFTSNNPLKYIDQHGLWKGELDEHGNIIYVAEKGDNLATFRKQYNIDQESAEVLFKTNKISSTQTEIGSKIEGAGLLQFNLKKTEFIYSGLLGYFGFTYKELTSKTQQQAIDHLSLAMNYYKGKGKDAFKVQNIFNYSEFDFGSTQGVLLRGKFRGIQAGIDISLMRNQPEMLIVPNNELNSKGTMLTKGVVSDLYSNEFRCRSNMPLMRIYVRNSDYERLNRVLN